MPPLDAADLSFDDLIPAQNRGGPAEKKPSAADLSFDDLIPSQTASAQPGAPAQQNALRDMQRNIAAGCWRAMPTPSISSMIRSAT